MVAERRRVPVERVIKRVMAAGGPLFVGTKNAGGKPPAFTRTQPPAHTQATRTHTPPAPTRTQTHTRPPRAAPTQGQAQTRTDTRTHTHRKDARAPTLTFMPVFKHKYKAYMLDLLKSFV
eukprot:GHVR01004827.1.p2 GENE.GHVR01004827.1~~GHVR01004827.1.p2  ORF type:complete len:120 (+),score=58.76 GHVR01004827.1:158-517(+)